ncbi:hypothetical protein NA57DRAFT_72251 [Rhizodiscina lignyota]|uniref:Nephrocystin 3-like N-terminal domain-containing protein n=1 Tax=Rhizodiscina lignyota TaxID=1504668 RepID=A0A9P4IS50_9PEZI|nr:hypothetical protein NA57DRAFT_72251 [Rhizodiscina lignyota]
MANSGAIFLETSQAFVQNLPSDESTILSTCSSAEQLIAEVQKLVSQAKDKARGDKWLDRITCLCDCLRPYFDIISLITQASQQYAAPLASHYTTFFDKLAKAFETFALSLPMYAEMVDLSNSLQFKAFGDRIKASVGAVYVDLFHFMQGIIAIFTKKDGGAKRTPAILANLCWRPFDARFGDILERLKFHQSVVRDELRLMHIHAEVKNWNCVVQEIESQKVERTKAEATRLEQRSQLQNIQQNISSEREEAARERLADAAEQLRAELKRLARHLDEIEQRLSIKNEDAARVNLANAQERLQSEVNRSSAAHAKESLDKLNHDLLLESKAKAEAAKRAVFETIMDWLSPPDFVHVFEHAKRIREENTSEWIMHEDQVTGWIREPGAPLRTDETRFVKESIWIKGNPGFGKTVLAAALVEKLIETTRTTSFSCPDVYYFFFKSDEPALNNTMAAKRAILAQALQVHKHDTNILDKFAFAKNVSSSGQKVATGTELDELLQVFINSRGTCFMVLDGIDESFFSRPNLASLIRNCPESTQQLEIGRKTSNDIWVYLFRSLDSMQAEQLLPKAQDCTELTEYLTIGADGMFLWARLMLAYLNSPVHNPVRRVAIMKSVTLPEGIEQMYERIADLICSGFHEEKLLARKVLMWLAYFKRRVTAWELQRAVHDTDEDFQSGADSLNDISTFSRTVLIVCCGLVEIDWVANRTEPVYFQFMHLSAKDYFTHRECRNTTIPHASLSLGFLESHVEMARTCLRFITFCLPPRPLSGLGRDTTLEALDQNFPFCSYAASYWIDHLAETAKANITAAASWLFQGLLLSLASLLSLDLVLMAWIESCYVNGRAPSAPSLGIWAESTTRFARQRWFIDIGGRDLVAKVSEFSRDLAGIEQSWGSTLREHPGLIWEEVSGFTKSKFLPQNSGLHVTRIPAANPTGRCSTQCLFKISETTTDGNYIGVLSIWPSRAYETQSQGQPMLPSMSDMQCLCSDWIARYELWSLRNEAQCTADFQCPIDSNEIYIQMKQSLHQDVIIGQRTGWKIQFPTAIGPNLRKFVVLRTMYSLEESPKDSKLRVKSAILETHFFDYSVRHWSINLATTEDSVRDTGSDEIDLESRLLRGNFYFYWLSFSPCGNYLFFLEHDLCIQPTAAVFRTSYRKNAYIPVHRSVGIRANLTETSLESILNSQYVKVAFHASGTFLGFKLGTTVYFWALTKLNNVITLDIGCYHRSL